VTAGRAEHVSRARWEDAQQAERIFWSAANLDAFASTVCPSLTTAHWAGTALEPPNGANGDWLEVGVGPLGVGCTHFLAGSGRIVTLDPLARASLETWHLTEPCRALVKECHERTERAVIGTAEQMPFEDASFDLAVLHNMLDHVQDPVAVLSEARRVLRAGGQLILAVDTRSVAGKLKFQWITRRRQQDTILVRAHPFHWTASEVIRLVMGAGFEIRGLLGPSRLGRAAGRSFRLRLVAR
jgi:SAM-dependent methyltransferase